STHVPDQIPEMLLREHHRGDELLEVAPVSLASKLDQCLLILIKNKTVFRAIDTKLMEQGTHLRREGEIGGRALLFRNDHSQFIYDLAFVHTLEKRADKAIGDHLRRLAAQKLRDPGNAVADNVVQ